MGLFLSLPPHQQADPRTVEAPRVKDLTGKKALITGAAAGIGRAIALELARAGVDLFLLDVDQQKLAEVAAEARRYQVEATAVACDLTAPAAITAALNRLRADWGYLDI